MSQNHNQAFYNKTVVFTGKLASMPRKQAQQVVQNLGGSTPPTVTKKTSYLVVGDEGFLSRIAKSRKLKQAEVLNEKGADIRIISETEFLEMAGLQTRETLETQYYALSDILRIFKNLRPDRVRYLEKWGLLKPAVKTHTEKYFQFKDLLIFRRVNTYLQNKVSLRSIARGLLQELAPEPQLAMDFEPYRPKGKILKLKRQEQPQRTAEEWYQIGYEYDCNPATFDQAIEAYQQALAIDPEYTPAIINLGTLYYEKGWLNQAEELFQKALGLHPDNAIIYYNLGNIYDDLENYDLALKYYQKSLELRSDYEDAHFNMAIVYEKLGIIDQAKKHWSAYLRSDPYGEWADIAREHLED